MKANARLEIEWYDSERVTLGWDDRKSYMKALRDRNVYRTVGYLIGETKRAVMLAGSRSDNGTYCDAMIIPTAAIKSRRKV